MTLPKEVQAAIAAAKTSKTPEEIAEIAFNAGQEYRRIVVRGTPKRPLIPPQYQLYIDDPHTVHISYRDGWWHASWRESSSPTSGTGGVFPVPEGASLDEVIYAFVTYPGFYVSRDSRHWKYAVVRAHEEAEPQFFEIETEIRHNIKESPAAAWQHVNGVLLSPIGKATKA